MKKNITSVFLALLIIVGFSGCMEEKVSCKDKLAQTVIEQMVSPNIQALIISEELRKISPAYAMAFMSVYQVLAGIGQVELLLNKDSGNQQVQEVKSKVKDEFKNAKFLFSDTKTISKDKELNKVVCSAKVDVDTLSYKSNYIVTYNIQYQNDNYSYELENVE